METIEQALHSAIKDWNSNVKAAGQDIEYILEAKCHKKKFFINKNISYENNVGEIKLIKIDRTSTRPVTRLLWGLDQLIPKVKKVPSHIVENNTMEALYKSLAYECIAIFAMSTDRLQDNRDMAEYDIENDRLKQDDSATEMVIKTIEDGEFYAKEDEFDVFMVTDNKYHVYTQHDIGLKNNGIASIPKEHCLVTTNAKVKIILDY